MDSDWFTKIYLLILAILLQNRDMVCKIGYMLFLNLQKHHTQKMLQTII